MRPVLRISALLLPFLILEGPTPSPGQETNGKSLPLPISPDFTWDANAWEEGSGISFWREGTQPNRVSGSRPPSAEPSKKKSDAGKPTLSPTSRQSEK